MTIRWERTPSTYAATIAGRRVEVYRTGSRLATDRWAWRVEGRGHGRTGALETAQADAIKEATRA